MSPIKSVNGIESPDNMASFSGVSSDDVNTIDGLVLPEAAVTPTLITTNLIQHLDAGDTNSYSGTGSTWVDLTSNVDGIIRGAPTHSSSDGGGSFSFDGVDDAIKFNYDDSAVLRVGEDSGEVNYSGTSATRTYGDVAGDGGITIQVWAKLTTNQVLNLWNNNSSVSTSDADSNRYKYYQGLEFSANAAGTITLFVFDGNGTNAPTDRRWRRSGTGETSPGTWELYTAVLYGDTANQIQVSSKIFVNGSEVSSYANASGTGSGLGYRAKYSSNQTEKYHGGVALGRGAFRQGSVAQVLVYNDILTDAEVVNNFNATKARYGY